ESDRRPLESPARMRLSLPNPTRCQFQYLKPKSPFFSYVPLSLFLKVNFAYFRTDSFGMGRGVTSASTDPMAQRMAPRIRPWTPGSSQVSSNSPHPMLNTRPFPYCLAQTTG